MSVYADPAGLTGIEGMARRAGEDISKARVQFDKHGEIVWLLDGLINQFQDDGDRIRQGLLAFLDKAGSQVLPATADAVAYARDYYARTDQASAEKLDATIRGADVIAEGKGVPGISPGPSNRDLVRFQDMCEPTAHLGHVEYDDSAYGMDYKPKWHEFISPSSQLRNAIYKVTGLAANIGLCDRAYDPFEVVLKPICGDWAGLARTGHVLNQVSGCVLDTAANLSWAAQCLPSAWDGNAADAADAHLYRLTKALRAAADSIDKMGAEYRSAARGAFDIADTIGGLLHEIADAAIAAAAAGAVAGGSAATGVGLPVALLAGLFGAYEIHRVVSGILDIISLVGKLDSLTSTLKSSANGFGEVSGDYPLPELPAIPALPH